MTLALKTATKIGLFGGIVSIYLCLIGMVEAFSQREIISGVITLGHAILLITGVGSGYLVAQPLVKSLKTPGQPPVTVSARLLLVSGLIVGLIIGVMLMIFVLIAEPREVQIFVWEFQLNLRKVFVNVSPKLLKFLLFGEAVSVMATLPLIGISGAAGLIGVLFFILPERISHTVIWGLSVVLLAGMLFDLLRITLARPGWPTTVSKFLFATRGISIAGAVTIFVVTAILVLARPYLPDLYRWLIFAVTDGLPRGFRLVFGTILSLGLLLRLVYFIAIEQTDLGLLPACDESSVSACLGKLGDKIGDTVESAKGIAIFAPTIEVLITLSELLVAVGITIGVLVIIFYAIKRRAAPVVAQDASSAVLNAQRYTNAYVSIALLLFIPIILGTFPSEVMVNVGLYVVMGFGLNIVVGLAGLLDLGYVAFFAVGAYSTALLTSPKSILGAELTFWQALPFVFLITAIAGLIVGAPVLRMRGDYLAIVTLGLGEIARFLALSDWLRPWLGGAQGILDIPRPAILGVTFAGPQKLYYLILAGCLVALFVSWRLKGSRVGRAWVAMREDEDVADAMGINTIQYKLMAFAMGAAIASFSGAIFAAKIGSVFPHSFNVLVSITALSLLIVGGLSSLPGVVVGAIALVGIPELLREFSEFRLLIYGAVLVAMMLLRPQGLLPDNRQGREIKDDERSQDAWLNAAEASPSGAGD